MAITFNVQPGYQFSASERVTYSKLNLLGTPGITLDGLVDSSEITDGAVTTQKLASGIDLNSKIADHNLALTKLAQGTHGQLLYYDANGDLVTLAPGTDGYFLSTAGAGADPVWKSASGSGSVAYSTLTTNGLADQYLTTDSSGAIEWIAKPNSNSASVFDTANLASIIAAGTPYSVTQAHGLGQVPEQVVVTLRCVADDTANTGYVDGDEILLSGTHCNKLSSQGEIPAASAIVDSTNVVVQVTDEVQTDASKFLVYKKSDATQVGIGSSANKFVFRIRAWASGAGSSASNNAGPLTSEPGYFYSATSSSSIEVAMASDGGIISFSHGFSATPVITRVVALCDSSANGYSVGDELDLCGFYQRPPAFRQFLSTQSGSVSASATIQRPAFQVCSNTSGVQVVIDGPVGVLDQSTGERSSEDRGLFVMNKSSRDFELLTTASWRLKLYAWK